MQPYVCCKCEETVLVRRVNFKLMIVRQRMVDSRNDFEDKDIIFKSHLSNYIEILI